MTAVCTTPRTSRHDPYDLRDVWLFSACSDAELDAITEFGMPIEVAAGQTLLAADDHRGCFVVLGGTAVVERAGRRIGAVGRGSIVGVKDLIGGRDPTVTVVATTAMRVLAVDRDELFAYLARGNAWSVRHRLEILTAELAG